MIPEVIVRIDGTSFPVFISQTELREIRDLRGGAVRRGEEPIRYPVDRVFLRMANKANRLRVVFPQEEIEFTNFPR